MSPSPHSGPSSSSSGGPWLWLREVMAVIVASVRSPDRAQRNPGNVPPHYASLHAGDTLSPHQHHEITARHGAIVAIGAVRRRAELEAIAWIEVVHHVALDESEPSGQHPDHVRHPMIRGGGKRDR